jgi:3-oxoacyl-[acyl-carrier-protein] synthase-1
MTQLAITATNSITAVGHDGRLTAASVRAGISRLAEYGDYLDRSDNPIAAARIRDINDTWDTPQRMAGIAALCLQNLLDEYARHRTGRPAALHLLLGVASPERPGPRYEESCQHPLRAIIEAASFPVELEVLPYGNAAAIHAFERAASQIDRNPAAVCIIGGVDSLLRTSTLNWFETDNRLKSGSYGRHHGLIAGEGAGFLMVEDPEQARKAGRPILATIAGLGLAREPQPRDAGSPGRNSGLTEACHAALRGSDPAGILAVFADLNGENARAREWAMADIRCFDKPNANRRLWTPANCYGDIGAASGAVMAGIVTQGFARGWLRSPTLITCSDDHGSCGAMVLASRLNESG